MKDDWHQYVYKKPKKQTSTEREAWRQLRKACLQRDGYTCQRCEKRSLTGQGLSAHHLIPRADLGENDINNLVTLCHKCHDLAEIAGVKTLEAIRLLEGPEPVEEPKKKPTWDTEETFVRPDWHKYVYGGQKREHR